MKVSEVTDPETQKFIAHIKQHPKFSPDGTIESDFFYTQPDGSFFDSDGYYFNPEGYDELGGYYDDYGVYRDPDFGFGEENMEEDAYQDIAASQHIESIMPLIRAAPSETEFAAVLTNFPYDATKKQIEDELASNKIEFEKLDPKFNAAGKLLKVDLTVKSKSMAEALLSLHGKKILSRNLKVEFPDYNLDLIVGETDLVKAEHSSGAKSAAKPKPAKEEQKHREVNKEDTNGKEEKKEEENEDGFIIEYFKSANAPHRPKPAVRYKKKDLTK
eukprot:TRINITY_DN4282_c0_g1_i7.p2 TRINITY_DN4282_c0_g1~~TRINITY_DN4282_c0_g1_i7.p2  ORF type:complete len:273 (-),score=110.47 TRINITY_DN4282_c0_g1_i7:146-964(-)